jgi:ABC-type dipeptide/oligopeptide/nickel transport system ATPase component
MNYKIAISGNAGSGKNTISNFILEELQGHHYKETHLYFLRKEIAFANPIKESLRLFFPSIKEKDLFGDSDARNTAIKSASLDGKSVTIRDLLKHIGESMKIYNKNIWINAFDHNFKKYKNYNVVLNTDLRFIDEFNYLKQNDFKFIRIIRQSQMGTHTHVSETEQYKIPNDDFDFVIYNDGSLDDLKNKCKDLCN